MNNNQQTENQKAFKIAETAKKSTFHAVSGTTLLVDESSNLENASIYQRLLERQDQTSPEFEDFIAENRKKMYLPG